MKTRKSITRHYSPVIAKKLSLPQKDVKKILSQFCIGITDNMKHGYDTVLEDYFVIATKKESRLKLYHNKKLKQQSKSDNEKSTGI